MIEHEPVLLKQVLEFLTESLSRDNSWRVLDGTLGLGGYSEAILMNYPYSEVVGVDRDLAAVEFSRKRLIDFGTRFRAVHVNFGDMKSEVSELGPFNAFVFDLGVSNMQLTEAERGFSFQNDGALDMRMNPHGSAQTAAEVLFEKSAQELADIFWKYGEERHSRVIASRIEEARRKGRLINTTGELVALIRETLPAPVQRKMGTHPARRVFQALRIYVNDELGELESVLSFLPALAAPGCAVIVVSYHSLEDRIIKHTFRSWEKEESKGRVITRRPVVPDEEEIDRNFKARSAKLRAFLFN